jgi:hypothetical protein
MNPSSNRLRKPCDDVELVDIIFVDIDGVLLPFGDGSNAIHEKYSKGCIFPDRIMDALTLLIKEMANLEFSVTNRSAKNRSAAHQHAAANTSIKGNPKLVLSSTWRARPDFIQDILSSFRSYSNNANASSKEIWKTHLDSFFDITDPAYHSTRHEEIYNWVKSKTIDRTKFVEKFGTKGQQKKPASTSVKQTFIIRSWIALDDEELVEVENALHGADKHAVKTTSSVGLTQTDVDLGMQLVKNQMMEFHNS